MAIEQITGQVLSNVSLATLPTEVLGRVSTLITIFQAIGGLIIVYLIFNIVNIFLNRKKAQETTRMRELLEEINKKLDKRR
jgi:uncharacterized membrane protein YuzA (DUF378 family)